MYVYLSLLKHYTLLIKTYSGMYITLCPVQNVQNANYREFKTETFNPQMIRYVILPHDEIFYLHHYQNRCLNRSKQKSLKYAFCLKHKIFPKKWQRPV